MIALLQPVMEQYIVTSRRFAVRMALQGGLSDYARGLRYDAARAAALAAANDNEPIGAWSERTFTSNNAQCAA
jgi:hypothetical protein